MLDQRQVPQIRPHPIQHPHRPTTIRTILQTATKRRKTMGRRGRRKQEREAE